jgi:hypothetical protein
MGMLHSTKKPADLTRERLSMRQERRPRAEAGRVLGRAVRTGCSAPSLGSHRRSRLLGRLGVTEVASADDL